MVSILAVSNNTYSELLEAMTERHVTISILVLAHRPEIFCSLSTSNNRYTKIKLYQHALVVVLQKMVKKILRFILPEKSCFKRVF